MVYPENNFQIQLAVFVHDKIAESYGPDHFFLQIKTQLLPLILSTCFCKEEIVDQRISLSTMPPPCSPP